MSLILEALRKSEAERRRGQSPDLYAELPPPSRRVAKRVLPWQWLALAAGTLAIAGWAARGYWNQSPAGAPAVVDTVHARDLVDTGPLPSAVAPSPVPIGGDSVPPATMPTAATPRPAMKASLPAATTMTATAPPPAPPRPAPGPTPPVAEAPAVAALSVAQPTTREILATAATLSPEVEAPSQPASLARAESLPAPATAAPLRLSDLSTAERQQLPPLKISMHMWGQGPDQRFAIIDGARVTEGDRIGAAVVDEISADGVVLGWNGLRVKLPVR